MLYIILGFVILNTLLLVVLVNNELSIHLPESKPEVGITPASYGQTKGYSNNDSEVGLVESKTPEQLEWQARVEEQKLRDGDN